MPLKKVTQEAVATNSQIEDQKKLNPDTGKPATFSQGGLNDETVAGLENVPVTAAEANRLNADTRKLEQASEQKTRVVNTYGLVAPKPAEYMEGQLEVANLVAAKIWACVVEHEWYGFYTQEELQECVNTATRHDYKFLVEMYGYTDLDEATDLCVLSLVDTIILGDNSYSMDSTDPVPVGRDGRPTDIAMSRWNLLNLLIKNYSFITTLFDTDGIQVELLNADQRLTSLFEGGRFMGLKDPVTGQYHDFSKCLSQPRLNPGNAGISAVSSQHQVEQIFKAITTNGGTPMGEAIERIFSNAVRSKMQTGTLKKPTLLWVITDGQPSGKDVLTVLRTIKAEFAGTKYGGHGMLFGFSQVGEDVGAATFLKKMDEDEVKGRFGQPVVPNPGVGDIVDCTSSYETELREVLVANPGSTFYTPQRHNLKVMIGVMMKKYDQADETNVTSVFTRMKVGGFF